MGIKLLDCTLRDGGHLNQSKFGENTIKSIIHGLEESRIDILEIGFVRNTDVGSDYAAVNDIKDFEQRFLLEQKNVEYCVMIQEDQYEIEKLPICTGKIKRIRVSFHDYDLDEGFDFCEAVVRKGYLCHVNPINITGYSDMELLALIQRTNKIKGISVFTLVDTFGSMTQTDLLRMLTLVQHNLNPDIAIGIHLHDNLQLAYTLGQQIITLVPYGREIIIDGSLLGMGRPPGNLCIELMMDFITKNYEKNYNVDAALDVIDDIIMPLKIKYPWGYETAYSLSAQYKLHRSYAEYLMKKQKLRTKQIRQILGMISNEKRSCYDERYIEKLYRDVIAVDIDDTEFKRDFQSRIFGKKVLLVAPGSSLKKYEKQILEYSVKDNICTISANFKCPYLEEDYIFCTNIKRMEKLEICSEPEKWILGAALKAEKYVGASYVNTNRLGWFGEIYWDNCMLMLLHLLEEIGVTECIVAGWDGFADKNNFANEQMETAYRYEMENSKVINILNRFFLDMDIVFLTPSLYEAK